MLSIAICMLAIEPLIATVAIVFLVPSVVIVGLIQPVLNGLSRSKITVARAWPVCPPPRGTDPASLIERL